MTDVINIPWAHQPAMVKALFKTDLPGGEPSALLHAAVGISGEVAELLDCASHGHMIEELGDAEFYLTALKQQVSYSVPAATYLGDSMSANEIFHGLTCVAGTILDLAKKHWAYNKPLDLSLMEREIGAFEAYVVALYHLFNIDREQVLRSNMAKLAVRYSSGSYSDAQAQVRADKPEEGGVAHHGV